MTIEHKSIPDANLHEVKGVIGATNGQILSASGGVGVWTLPYNLQTSRETVVLTGSQAASQPVTTNDVAQNVLFGALQATTDVNLSATGVLTINTTGFYKLKFNLNFGRTTTAGSAFLFARLLINGTPTGFVQGVQLDSNNISIPFQADYDAFLTAASTVTVEMYRDSAGVANGGLVAVTTPALAGWADAPSSWVRVYKVQGVVS